MAATLSAYGSNVAGSCRQPHGTVFKKLIIQVSKTIKITYQKLYSTLFMIYKHLLVSIQAKAESVIYYCCLKFHLELSLLKSKGAKPGVQSPSETNASFSSVPGTAFGMMR